jgi:hypothetical protein
VVAADMEAVSDLIIGEEKTSCSPHQESARTLDLIQLSNMPEMDRISWCPAMQSVSDCVEQIGFLVFLPNAGESAYVPLSTFAVVHQQF